MTVRDWIVGRSASVPGDLTASVLDVLGSDADAPDARTGELCLAAAARALNGLLENEDFGRDSALPLLAIDALTTFAFEHASESGAGPEALRALAQKGARSMSQLAAARG